jgi:hypothetical protein
MPGQIKSIEAEVQRLQCLQALGITVYHPRFRLPGAKPSVQGIWPDAETLVHAEAPQRVAPATQRMEEIAAPRVAAHETARVQVARPSVMADDAPSAHRQGAPPATPAARVSSPALTSAPRSAEAASTTVQNFQLLFLQIDDELALVNQIPALARPQLQDRQLALLTNLLRWLGKSVPAQSPRMFRWPLPGLEQMAGSMDPQTSLLHFLEQANSERGFRFLLQLGPQAMAPATHAWQAYATHSLDEMLALPALKREVWETLQPLHALLHAGSQRS